MYHTMLPPHMMVQIVGGGGGGGGVQQQANGQTNLQQIPTTSAASSTNNHCPSPHVYSGQNQHRLMPGNNPFPVEVIQIMGVGLPQYRRPSYGTPHSPTVHNNWHRRNTSNQKNPNNNNNNRTTTNTVVSTPPPPAQSNPNFPQTQFAPAKKQHLSNTKSLKRPPTSKDNNKPQCEIGNCDSGFSSRSPTPNKAEGSATESSDESSNSTADQEANRPPDLHSFALSVQNVTFSPTILANVHPQYFHQQRPLNYYHPAIPAARSTQIQNNYQSKKRYQNGRSSSTSPNHRTQHRRRYTNVMVPALNFIARPFIAPDRFLARSHLMVVTGIPDGLIRYCKWDRLSKDIWQKFLANQQSEETYKKKMLLWKCLYIFIKTAFPRFGLFLVGSTMNGFGSDGSDVDMCLLVKNMDMVSRNESILHLTEIRDCLKECNFIDKIMLIEAKVPILKFHDASNNLEVDLNVNNAVGIRNTHMLYCYSKIDWRVRPLVLIVKLWAQYHNINDAKNMTISSYSLVLMVIHFLQYGVRPAVLPCLQAMYGYKFNSQTDIHNIDIHEELVFPEKSAAQTNRQPLGQLLVEFFRYYSEFDYARYAVSVRLAKKIPIEHCRHARSTKNDPYQWKYLCIEEPFDLTNTARSVYDYNEFMRIVGVFQYSHIRLKESMNLASIFTKPVPINHPRP